LIRSPSVPYVAPFAVFLGLLAVTSLLPRLGIAAGGVFDQASRVVILIAVLWIVARPVLDFRVRSAAGTLAIGVAVFVIWIGPDLLFPDYRKHWLFTNSIMGAPGSTLDPVWRANWIVLTLRTIRAAVIVPMVEELFWRAWLMRWIISPDFRSIPLGAYTPLSFWAVALLFASEHGSYWDVGLIAGVIYNWWMIRTRSLGDLILAHAVTNGCLSAYVMITGKWEYWS
jgi:CAAX prenyl protease-like protein